MRYENMRELMQNVSPDVMAENMVENVEQAQPPTEASRAALAATRGLLEDRFLSAWDYATCGDCELEREYRFHEHRRWRFDFADPKKRIAYEIQGGMYKAESGHRSKQGVARDQEKLNAAIMDGWKVFQVNASMIGDPEYMDRLAEFHLREDYI